jgi:histidinol-phosphate/aromatic aminotransferase/cobyric acid decarboxylase-like protein
MMSNENPFPPSEALIEKIVEMARIGNLYPPSGEDIRRRIAELDNFSEDNVFLGNGSTEVIDIVIRTLVALGALEDSTDFEGKCQSIRKERAYLSRELSTIEGLKAFPSEGNFVLVDATDTGFSSEEIVQALLKEDGIFLRPMSFHKMRKGFFRVTVRTHEENRLCVETLRRFFTRTR